MEFGKKISIVTEFRVLNKYQVKLLIVSSYKIDRYFVKFEKVSQYWAIDFESFKNFFPKVASFFLYKTLFSNKSVISREDFKEFVPSRSYYQNPFPLLTLSGDYILFLYSEGIKQRKEIAKYFHSIENLEKSLKTLTIKIGKGEIEIENKEG